MAKARRREPRREETRRTLKTKEVIHFINEDTGVDVKCKEIFKDKKLIIHYPFNRDGNPKYKTVKRFVFEGFDNNSSLPTGIQKSATYGLGFTKYVAPIMDVVLDAYKITEVNIVKTGKPSLTAKKLTLTEEVLKKLYPLFRNINDRQREERIELASKQLNQLFPSKFKAQKRKYSKNSIHVAIESWTQDIAAFSDQDKSSIKDLFDKLLLTDDFLSTETLLSTKANLDKQYIDDVIESFEKLMSQKNESDTLEKKWQKFLKTHNWVFSYVFTQPIMLHKDEAYVGGKNLSNKDGKVTDFLMKNELTQNVAFLEIKTHRTKLIGSKTAYRGESVYPMSKDLTGGITQVLDQRDNFQKEYYSFKGKTGGEIESVNSKCVVLMGSVSDLSPHEISSFELFRSNSKDVEILTFDELLARIKKLTELVAKAS